MTTTTTMTAPMGAHTAGIYADSTMDGPEIGTLVVVIDRAKNLPNRKSMGKQDPYCAARLGKEAKKTETDRRGGQTPRWDQELRFTVHDSPDFYRLKVSVFNDDKKTELIGESWLSLDDIVVRGGGRSDQWHQLHCKGRYAGDIRIELTYYDIRPRQAKSNGRQQSTTVDDVQSPSREGLSGPRQPKPVKRRPLPANPSQVPSPEPVNQTSSPMHSTPPIRQALNESPHYHANEPYGYGDYDHEIEQGPLETYPAGNSVSSRHQSARQQSYNDLSLAQGGSTGQLPTLPYNSSRSHFNHEEQNYHVAPANADDRFNYEERSQRGHNGQFAPLSAPDAAAIPQQLYRPEPLRPQNINNGSRPPFNTTAPVTSNQQSLADHSTLHAARSEDMLSQHRPKFWGEPEPLRAIEADQPPLPPVHRNSTSSAATPPGFADYHPLAHSASSSPTHMRHGHFGSSGSPLAQVHHVDQHPNMASSPHSQRFQPAARSQGANYGSASAQQQRSSVSSGSRVPYTPPSLVAGFRSQATGEAVPRPYSEVESYSNSNGRYAKESSPSFNAHAMPPVQAPGVGSERAARSHRNSVPAFNNGGPNSEPHTRRKAVSPQPEVMNSERRHSDLPFSPDSFDAFNPNVNAAQLSSQGGARYTTPEQARETAIQSERDAKRGDEPIIGDDGRIIDPSDHLPADTWAPEPTPKGPKRGPEVTLRFRQGPVQSTPVPRATHPSPVEARPNILTNQPHQSQSAENSPTTAVRARLQKKSRAAMTHPQPYSSPAVPTLDHTPPPSKPQHLPRHYASDYPLRERDNSPYLNSNGPTSWQRNGAPPPVPEKLPIHHGQEEWGSTNALSEEMRSIDIGMAPQGGHRTRARRYGF